MNVCAEIAWQIRRNALTRAEAKISKIRRTRFLHHVPTISICFARARNGPYVPACGNCIFRTKSALALRRRWRKQVADERILGEGDFVQRVLSDKDDLGKDNLRVPPTQKALSALAEKVCQFHKVTSDELRLGSRRHELVEARGELSGVAVLFRGDVGKAPVKTGMV